MSDYKFNCPHCQQHLSAEASMIGMEVDCPTCANRFIVPEQLAAPILSATNTQEPAKMCPYCRSEITPTDKIKICPSCHTPHHSDCWVENKGCTVFGCTMAPPDEEKIAIGRQAIPLPTVVPSYESSGPQVRPWLRLWARMMDGLLFGLIFGVVAAFVYAPLLELQSAALNIVFLFVYIFVEPAMLCSWGTTPGKALLNIRVRRMDGQKLTYGEAIMRSLKVWFRGQGIGIPLVALFTQIHAYNVLTKEGATSWDQDGRFKVIHRTVGIGKVILTVLAFIGFMFLIAVGSADL